jgi:hypothetical protein
MPKVCQWQRDFIPMYNNALQRGEEPSKKAEQIRRARERAAQYVLDYLSTHRCVECGESDPVVLEFDHVRGKKTLTISQMIRDRYSLDNIQKEIDKCDVLCANCHREKTRKQLGWHDRNKR